MRTREQAEKLADDLIQAVKDDEPMARRHQGFVDAREAVIAALTGPARCDHEWKDIDSQSDDTVKCEKCEVFGARQPDGSIYWPAT